MPTRKELEGKLEAKQKELASIYKEAKNDAGDLDFNNVKSVTGVSGSMAVVEHVRKLDEEMNGIGTELEGIRKAEEIEAKQREREEKLDTKFRHGDPDKSDRKGNRDPIGKMVTQNTAFKAWHDAGQSRGVTMEFADELPSDFLAKGMAAAGVTLGSKTLFETGAGWAPESIRLPGFVPAVARPIQFIDIIPMGNTGQAAIKYMEETTRTHAAAEKAEGATFAESTFELTEQSATVQKITDSVPVTDEQLEDVAQVESYLNSRLVFGLRQRLDTQCLLGNGTPPNLRGLANVSGIQTQARGTDPVPDAFFKAMTKIRVTGRAVPTHHVIHPTDWESVRLLRTADGIYIWGNPSESGPERMWGLPVVQCDAGSAATGYVGSFEAQWVTLFERRGVTIEVGYTGTQFTEGKRTIRGDMRAVPVFFRPAAFSSVTGL